MPIVHFVNNRSQTAGGMKTVIGYVSQEKKTVREDRKYVTGINCSPQTAYKEMCLTKQLYNKTGGRLYYHLVQSIPKGYDISPKDAHQIACEFAGKAFGKYECVVATHIDREHIHSHIVFNSVSFVDGKKYHSNLDSVKELMKLSDEICEYHGVSALDSPENKLGQKKTDKMSDREYRSADKGESWKIQLMFAITECMKEARSRKQFCYLMHCRYGYAVSWEDNRKHITYTTPNGYRCRDKRLHDDKFLKEAMEREFRIRYEILNGEEQAAAQAGGTDRNDDSDHRTKLAGGGRGADQRGGVAGRGHKDVVENNDGSTDAESPRPVVGDSGAESSCLRGDTGADESRHITGDDGLAVTGWEDERGILLSAERARRLARESQQTAYQSRGDLAVGAAVIISGIADMASIIDNAPADDEDVYRGSDSRQIREEREKKESLGMKM